MKHNKTVKDLAYIRAAKRMYDKDGEIEIDDNAKISKAQAGTDDPGAYVEAWVWVYDEDIRRGER